MLLIRFPSPAYTWAQVKAREGMGGRGSGSLLSVFPSPRRSGPAEVGGGAHRAGRTPPPPPRILGLCCRCARAPRLPHCGSRGPINRESDVLRSREWRGPGSWGRGRAEPPAPAPLPQSREPAAGSHPQSRAEGLCPLGSRGEGLATPPPGGHVGGLLWDTCGRLL